MRTRSFRPSKERSIVLIYFDKPTQDAVARRLASHLRPGGFLVFGHSESVIGSGLRLAQWAPAVFQRL